MARPKGALNYINRDFRQYLKIHLYSRDYQAKFWRRIWNGEAPALELYLWQMLHGKPTDRVELNVSAQVEEDLTKLSLDELEAMAKQISADLAEAKAIENSLPAEVVAEARRPALTLISPTDSPADSVPDFEER
jgi:hypothetical protein